VSAMWKKLKKRLSMLQHKKARLFVLIGIILFNLGLWFVSSLLSYWIQPEAYDDFFGALMKSGITWMLDPGFYDPETLLSIQIIAILTVIISMVSFTGGIIAYVSDAVGTFIEKSEEGTKPLYLYDHLLILNWNIKALELIADFCFDETGKDIVVVSPYPKKDIEAQIDAKLYDMPKKGARKVRVVVVQGNIVSKQVLDRVCIQAAKTIVIFSDEEQDAALQGYQADITAVKTLMLVDNISKSPLQTIIVEIKETKTRELIAERFAAKNEAFPRVIPMLSDELMGKLIAQTVFFPELNEVYAELMSSEGAEFYSAAEEDPLEYLKTHGHAIPLYRHKGRLYVVARNDADVAKQRSVPKVLPRTLSFQPMDETTTRTIVVFGKNNKIPYIVSSIRAFEHDGNVSSKVIQIPSADIATIREAVKDLTKVDTILLLSDDTTTSNKIDSDVLIALLLIQDVEVLKTASVVIELIDPRHFDIARSYGVEHTIISNRYVSHMMAQIAKNRELYYLYNDMLTYDESDEGVQTRELYVYPAKRFLKGPFPKTFASAFELVADVANSSEDVYQIVGVVQNQKIRIFSGDLDKAETISIANDDSLVIVSE
jgi:hypothetical protein